MADLGLGPIINAAGTMTVLGASTVPDEIIAAASAIMQKPVDMSALLDAASDTIAHATGAEAGHMTACTAAGITLAVAATMTGTDVALVERLPDCHDLPNQVVLQKGHNCYFNAEIGQMVRLSGAQTVEIGTITRTTPELLRGALNENTTAALYVVSHHAAQVGMIDFATFCEICHDANVPVIVDAAAEYDLRGFIETGADLALYSAHKFLGGLTGGIIAGRADLVAACRAQDRGIGRTMKIGKEGIAGAIAALERWPRVDKAADKRTQESRIQAATQALTSINGLTTSLEPDSTGNPVTRLRLHIDPAGAGLNAADLNTRLIQGTPPIYVREHDSDPNSLLLDPCNLTDDEMNQVCQAIKKVIYQSSADQAAPANVA